MSYYRGIKVIDGNEPSSGPKPPRASLEGKHIMGLTIHYKFQSDVQNQKAARQLIEQLRQKALDLPFKEVGEIIDLSGESADFDELERDNPNRWLLVQAGNYLV
jgi:hypothetical protein